jgi:putative membrane protein
MKVNVSEEKKKALEKKKRVTHTELYFGRLLIFLLIGLIQSTIIGLVDLYVLGVQCTESPFLFMLACWFSSLIYVMLIFTLTISFGDVGKAIAVILMVIQVAGSGGTFPIELAPDVFRNLYPMLPFVHTMDALRECIAGMYKNVYWDELGVLAMYLVPILILGLLLRRPVEKLNLYIEEKLEEVKFI